MHQINKIVLMRQNLFSVCASSSILRCCEMTASPWSKIDSLGPQCMALKLIWKIKKKIQHTADTESLDRCGGVDTSNSEHNLMLRFDNRFPTHRPPGEKTSLRRHLHIYINRYINIATTRPNLPSGPIRWKGCHSESFWATVSHFESLFVTLSNLSHFGSLWLIWITLSYF